MASDGATANRRGARGLGLLALNRRIKSEPVHGPGVRNVVQYQRFRSSQDHPDAPGSAVKDSKKKPSTSTTDARLAYVIKQQQEILRRLDAIAPPAKEPDEDKPPKE